VQVLGTRASPKLRVTLRALGRAATELRQKLGESLASIQKFDAPILQATTSSLEALRAYSMGCEVEYRQGKLIEAIPFYKRAIELDNNFALAYFHLAGMYGNTLQLGSMEAAEKAFALKDRVSERREARDFCVLLQKCNRRIR
jgi:hypothetical protein